MLLFSLRLVVNDPSDEKRLPSNHLALLSALLGLLGGCRWRSLAPGDPTASLIGPAHEASYTHGPHKQRKIHVQQPHCSIISPIQSYTILHVSSALMGAWAGAAPAHGWRSQPGQS